MRPNRPNNPGFIQAVDLDRAGGFCTTPAATGHFTYGGQLFASSSQLNIGDDSSDTSSGQGNWNGRLDDLAIWTRALTSQELATIYTAGLAGQSLMTLIPEPSIAAMFLSSLVVAAGIRSRRR